MMKKAVYHLPGLFEFTELYRLFLQLYSEHREYFYDWCEIGSIYGAPADCLWAGGRVGTSDTDPEEVLTLLSEYEISARLTFSNSLLTEKDLEDRKCRKLCSLFETEGGVKNGVIVHSELLTDFLIKNYPDLYLVSSTTKVLKSFADFRKETDRPEFAYVVPDFRLNRAFDRLKTLSEDEKNKAEFLVNECCYFGCHDRKACYEAVSRRNLGQDDPFECRAPGSEQGYLFSKAMENPGFIGIDDIKNIYLPMGFANFKIEGRTLGSALVFEMLLYYLIRPECQLRVREEIYLDSMLDLF